MTPPPRLPPTQPPATRPWTEAERERWRKRFESNGYRVVWQWWTGEKESEQ